MDQETISFAEEADLYYTKRAMVLEGILIDRMGYKPKTINGKLLLSMGQKIKEYEKKAGENYNIDTFKKSSIEGQVCTTNVGEPSISVWG